MRTTSKSSWALSWIDAPGKCSPRTPGCPARRTGLRRRRRLASWNFVELQSRMGRGVGRRHAASPEWMGKPDGARVADRSTLRPVVAKKGDPAPGASFGGRIFSVVGRRPGYRWLAAGVMGAQPKPTSLGGFVRLRQRRLEIIGRGAGSFGRSSVPLRSCISRSVIAVSPNLCKRGFRPPQSAGFRRDPR